MPNFGAWSSTSSLRLSFVYSAIASSIRRPMLNSAKMKELLL